MPGALLAITSPQGRAARDALAGQPGVRRTILVGDGVHAVVDDADLRVPQLRNALAQAGVACTGIALAIPSIEDVFVALLENEGTEQ